MIVSLSPVQKDRRLAFGQLVAQEALDGAAGDQERFVFDNDGKVLPGHRVRAGYSTAEYADLEVAGRRVALEGAALALHQRPGPA